MKRRLPPQPREWIDRAKTLEFHFEGNAYQGYAGDVINSALLANDVRLLGRSFKYHRARGIYSLADHDANALFCDGGRTHLRGDTTELVEGLALRAVNTFGGLRADRMRIADRFSKWMPVGFYYKAFFKPRFLFPFHERQFRRLAGLGEIDVSAAATRSPKDYSWCDVLVVGSGPSGLSAARAAAEVGARVLVVEQAQRPGGSYGWEFAGARGVALDDSLRQLEALGVEIRCRSVAVGCYADRWIALCDDEKLTKVRARAVVFTTGAIEQPAVFRNNDLPGVMLASAAQRLIHQYAVKPFDAAALLVANAEGYRAALDLAQAGVAVLGVVDLRRDGERSALADEVASAGIPVFQGSALLEATAARGGAGVKGAVVCPIAADGSLETSRGQSLDCDGVAVSVGFAPNAALPYQAGARFTYCDAIEQFVPESLPEGVYAAGRLNGVFALDDRIADGRRAGLKAARQLGLQAEPASTALRHTGESPSHPYPIFSHPKQKNFVDFDEDVQLHDMRDAHQEGYDNIELMKRYSTFGMGPSQGKLANMNAVRILARLNGSSIDETGTTTSRPFYTPTPLGHLAGRRFHPMRRTPIHDWHEANEAELVHAGSWYRAEYYRRDGSSRSQRILSEARNVRRSVGLIDLSTLGKLLVQGPDAITLLERIYTGRFKRLPVGRQRYAVALDESGVVIDDGVVARLAEDRFYVTATSGGVESFYREMQRWVLVWGLDVTLVNATSQYAAMNLAGPRSREVLARATEIDLSPASFPYLGVREGEVAGVRARVLRVGFVGELGYEVHVPAGCAMYVWNALFEAGECFDIQPFGTEAQRLLRLEKGHLIVGHDTDALTDPYEAGLGATLAAKKDFFVGQRSLEILDKKERKRMLVGIRWPDEFAGPLPEECHLIVDGGEITGRVTSIARESTLGYPLGMAFVHPDFAESGSEVAVRVERGALTRAVVTPLSHYDPENLRQSESPEGSA